MLTQAQCDQYRDDGYVLVENVLETETLADLHRITEEIVASAAGIEDHTQHPRPGSVPHSRTHRG